MIRARITRAAWFAGPRMYIEVEIDGRKMHLKVPFKYNRVTCKVLGLTPIQSMHPGDIVDICFDTKKYDDKEYKVLTHICLVGSLSRDSS